MVPAIVDVGLLGAYLLLLGLVGAQYARGAIASQRVPLLVGMCLTWLAYSLLQVTEDGPFVIDPPFTYLLDGLAVVLFVAGLYGLYWWWQHRDCEATDGVTVQ